MHAVKYKTVRYLKEPDLDRLRDIDFSANKKLERVRDFYVFCSYTGLAYQDAARFQKGDIQEFDGIKCIL